MPAFCWRIGVQLPRRTAADTDALFQSAPQPAADPLPRAAPAALLLRQTIQRGQLHKESRARLDGFMSTLRNMQVGLLSGCLVGWWQRSMAALGRSAPVLARSPAAGSSTRCACTQRRLRPRCWAAWPAPAAGQGRGGLRALAAAWQPYLRAPLLPIRPPCRVSACVRVRPSCPCPPTDGRHLGPEPGRRGLCLRGGCPVLQRAVSAPLQTRRRQAAVQGCRSGGWRALARSTRGAPCIRNL